MLLAALVSGLVLRYAEGRTYKAFTSLRMTYKDSCSDWEGSARLPPSALMNAPTDVSQATCSEIRGERPDPGASEKWVCGTRTDDEGDYVVWTSYRYTDTECQTPASPATLEVIADGGCHASTLLAGEFYEFGDRLTSCDFPVYENPYHCICNELETVQEEFVCDEGEVIKRYEDDPDDYDDQFLYQSCAGDEIGVTHFDTWASNFDLDASYTTAPLAVGADPTTETCASLLTPDVAFGSRSKYHCRDVAQFSNALLGDAKEKCCKNKWTDDIVRDGMGRNDGLDLNDILMTLVRYQEDTTSQIQALEVEMVDLLEERRRRKASEGQGGQDATAAVDGSESGAFCLFGGDFSLVATLLAVVGALL